MTHFIVWLTVALSTVDVTVNGPTADDQQALQTAIDLLAMNGGGNLYLKPGEYKVLSLKATHAAFVGKPLRIIGLKVDGQGPVRLRTRKSLPGDADPGPLLFVGEGWSDWTGPKIEGLLVENIEFDGSNATGLPTANTLFTLTGDKRSTVRYCSFFKSRNEAFITGGGTSSREGQIYDCRAEQCGLAATSGTGTPLAGFNINSYAWTGSRLFARECGHGIECGGTACRFSNCTFIRAQGLLGSSVYGCSNNWWTSCTWQDCSVTVSNGIGKMADLRWYSCNFVRSPWIFQGSRDVNSVDLGPYGGMPSTTGPCQVVGCHFLGETSADQAIRCTNWYEIYDHGPDVVFSQNKFCVLPDRMLIVQGRLANSKFTFSDNDLCGNTQLGIVYTSLPGGELLPPIPTTQFVFTRNKAAAGSQVTLSGDTTGWPAEYPVK